MLAISIRQPWASLIVAGHKDIENRIWSTSNRGPVLIHASAKMTDHEYRDAFNFVRVRFGEAAALRIMPARCNLPMGGIIGAATITGMVKVSRSKWFVGPIGWQLADAAPLPFQPCKGKLGLFSPSTAEPAEPVLL